MFYKNFEEICKEKRTTPTAVLKDLGLSTSKVTAWKKGSIPKQEVLKLLATKLDTSVDCFFAEIERVDSSKKITNNVTGNYNAVGENSVVHASLEMTPQEHELISVFRNLSEIDKAKYLYQMSEDVKKNKSGKSGMEGKEK